MDAPTQARRATTPKRKSRTVYKTIKTKVPKHYVIGGPDEDENHEMFTRTWYRQVTKSDDFWADFFEKVPKGVLTARFPVTVNTTFVADTARVLKERLERQATRSIESTTAVASPTDTCTPIVRPRCSTCGSHIDDGYEGCLACTAAAAADDNDDVHQVKTSKCEDSEPEENMNVLLEAPTQQRVSPPIMKREKVESDILPTSIYPAEQEAAEVSYVYTKSIGNRYTRKRAKLEVVCEEERATIKAEDSS